MSFYNKGGLHVSTGRDQILAALTEPFRREQNKENTFAQTAGAYLQWVRANRTARFWALQKRVLHDEVLPLFRKLPLMDVERELFRMLRALPKDMQGREKCLVV